MRAVIIKDAGPHGRVELGDTDDLPVPAAGQVRVRVHAAGLNRADLLQRAGKYPAPPGYPPHIPGLEFAGEVEQIAAGRTLWKLGDRVFGITAGGAQAEYVLTTESNLARMPNGLSWAEGGGMPETYITAHDALFTRGRLQLGERVLIHAVASGVGTAALQLAHCAGATVYGTSRTASKLDRLRDLHLDAGIAVADNPATFVTAVETLTDHRGVDLILDLVGGEYFPLNLRSLGQCGRIVCVGTTAGSTSEIDLGLLLRKRATIMGTVLRARSVEEKAEATRKFAAHVLPLVATRSVRPRIDRIYRANQVAAAYDYLASNTSVGKVVLSFD
jgi:putative PIG3 family NAD(P)H quinone oxidoreductase